MSLINETGSSSIIVLLVLLILVTLGSFAVTSSYSNIKLGEVAHQSLDKYYNTDSVASMKLLDIAIVLEAAQQSVCEDLMRSSVEDPNQLYLNYISTYLSDVLDVELAGDCISYLVTCDTDEAFVLECEIQILPFRYKINDMGTYTLNGEPLYRVMKWHRIPVPLIPTVHEVWNPQS